MKYRDNNDLKIFTTGMSFGGAISQLIIPFLLEKDISLPIHNYSFSAPRVGKEDYQ
jgi:hypothetical protein